MVLAEMLVTQFTDGVITSHRVVFSFVPLQTHAERRNISVSAYRLKTIPSAGLMQRM